MPAVAGPFDLGNVVVRAALFVDKTTAQVKVISDPLPTILQGIPLDVRDVRVLIDKPHFIVNPTNCSLKHVAATVGSTAGALAHVSDCSRSASAGTWRWRRSCRSRSVRTSTCRRVSRRR